MVQSRVQIVIPTFNERDNLRPFIEAIRRHHPDFGLLIVDDDSPDGTGELAKQMAQRDALLRVLHRTGQRGYGRSLIDGMLHTLGLGSEFVFQMDADLSHDPQYLTAMLEAAEGHDVVIGSRYTDNRISVVNWPLRRLILSVFANYYVRAITRMPVYDATSGFRCWRATALKMIDLESIRSDGYSFQVETLYRAYSLGLKIAEVPIVFVERRTGSSKMSKRVILESALMPWRLALSRFLGRIRGAVRSPRRIKSRA